MRAMNGKADIVAYLVAHNQFKGLEFKSTILDFCGIKKSIK